MKLYSSYKDSGVAWIGKIPNEWDVKRIDYLFKERKVKVDDTTYPPLSVTMEGIKDQLEDVAKSDDTSNRKLALKNDFVINSRSDRKGSSGLSFRDGSVSVVNTVLKPSNIDPNYAKYLLKSYYFIEEYFRNGKGIHFDLWSTKYPLMKIIKIPVLSTEEQKQISNYLDYKTLKIDTLIEKTEQKIELLNEQRTSLINTTVTKGLNPNVEMKDSGVEWIGEIPSKWDVKPLKYVSEYNINSLGKNTNPHYELNYLEISDVDSLGNIKKPTHYIFSNSPSRCRRIVKKDNIIISTVRTYLKSIGFIREEVEDLICSTGFCVIEPDRTVILPNILFYMVRMESFISTVISLSEGVSYPAINSDKLVGVKILIPPFQEQQQIADYLDKETSKIDILMTKESKRAELLKEYRKSLISDVVTGKVDVRNEVLV